MSPCETSGFHQASPSYYVCTSKRFRSSGRVVPPLAAGRSPTDEFIKEAGVIIELLIFVVENKDNSNYYTYDTTTKKQN